SIRLTLIFNNPNHSLRSGHTPIYNLNCVRKSSQLRCLGYFFLFVGDWSGVLSVGQAVPIKFQSGCVFGITCLPTNPHLVTRLLEYTFGALSILILDEDIEVAAS